MDISDITTKLSEPETQEIVGNFINVLAGFVRSKGDINVTDTGSFVFRVVDGAPQLTVSRDFIEKLGTHSVVLSMDSNAQNDVVARLGQVDNTVVKFDYDGSDYHPTISHTVIAKQPLHIQHMMKRASLSDDEFGILKEHLLKTNISFEVVDKEVHTKEEPVNEDEGLDNLPDDIKQLIMKGREPKPRIKEPVKPRRVVVDEDDEMHVEEESSEEEPPRRPRRVVEEPSEDEEQEEEEEEEEQRPITRKATTIHVSDDEDDEPEPVRKPAKKTPVKKEEPDDAEMTSKKVSISYFRKKADGTRDKTIGRIDDFVFRIHRKPGKSPELVCIGKFQKSNKRTIDLTRDDVKRARNLGYSLDPKYK